MKRIIVATLLLCLSTMLFAQYPPEGWTADIREAIVQAEREDKMILLNFTGSDWCTWCFKLNDEVWNTSEFQVWSEDTVVKVFLDFPSNIQLSEETLKQNSILQQILGVRSYPTVWLLDSDLTPILRSGYQAGGAGAYIARLEGDRMPLPEDKAQKFREGFRAAIEEYIGPIG